MRVLPMTSTLRHRTVGYAVVAALGAALHGCGVHELEIPDLSGPSERAESLVITATPDMLVADGRSFAIVRATFRDRNAQPLPGRAISFRTADESGRFASIGTLSSDVAVTDGNGVAQIVYTAPPRTDATANQTVLVMARSIGNDFNGAEGFDRQARIELRSAEPRLFPLNPLNTGPTCFFIVEAALGLRAPVTVLFQTTSFDTDGTIVRYEWRFSDSPNPTFPTTYSPDTAHVFTQPGTWRVTHTVTDDDGGQSSCFVDLTIS